MSAVPVAEQMTADEFLAREGPQIPWESLVEGEVVVNDPLALHGRVQANLLYALETWVRAGADRGQAALPRDVLLDERNVYKPDILWYAHDRAPDERAPRPYPMPSLAAEIRSPSTWRYDLGAKKAGYERHGLPELWLLDTVAETVLVFRRARPDAAAFDVALELSGGQQIRSPLLPGFALGVEEAFLVPGS